MATKKLETTREFCDRMTREARERRGVFDVESGVELAEEGKIVEIEEEKVDSKRKLDSDVKVSERYSEEDANITIISSDGVSFKVHSFTLLRASPIFKDMVGFAQTGSQRGPLELPDEFVEHSQVVEATLDILYDSEITSFKDDKLYHHVIGFARKYEMSTVLKTISNQLRVHATLPDKGHALRLLRIAIDLGECDLMTAVVRATCGHVWPKHPGSKSSSRLFDFSTPPKKTIEAKPTVSSLERDERSFFPSKTLTMPTPSLNTASKEYVEGGKAFDLGSWPYSEFAALPTPVAWAILRAEQVARQGFTQERTDTFGRELQKALDSMYVSVAARSGRK